VDLGRRGVVIGHGRSEPGFEPGAQPFLDGFGVGTHGLVEFVFDVENQSDVAAEVVAVRPVRRQPGGGAP